MKLGGQSRLQKVLFLFKLNPHVREEYRRWTVTRDQAVVPYEPGILRYHVWEVQGWLKEGQPPYDVVEELEVDSWAAFLKAFDGPEIKKLRDEFTPFIDASVPPVFIYGDLLKFK